MKIESTCKLYTYDYIFIHVVSLEIFKRNLKEKRFMQNQNENIVGVDFFYYIYDCVFWNVWFIPWWTWRNWHVAKLYLTNSQLIATQLFSSHFVWKDNDQLRYTLVDDRNCGDHVCRQTDWMCLFRPSRYNIGTCQYHATHERKFHNTEMGMINTLKTNFSWIARVLCYLTDSFPDSTVHGANIGPVWGRQDPGGPHVGPMNFVIWDMYSIENMLICVLVSWKLKIARWFRYQ